jgi:hypothetical protein
MKRAFNILEDPNKTIKQQKNEMKDKCVKFIHLIQMI